MAISLGIYPTFSDKPRCVGVVVQGPRGPRAATSRIVAGRVTEAAAAGPSAKGLPWNPLGLIHGSLNVPIEHHPTIRYMVYNGYYKVMSNIPKMGHLPTPVIGALMVFQLLLENGDTNGFHVVNLIFSLYWGCFIIGFTSFIRGCSQMFRPIGPFTRTWLWKILFMAWIYLDIA